MRVRHADFPAVLPGRTCRCDVDSENDIAVLAQPVKRQWIIDAAVDEKALTEPDVAQKSRNQRAVGNIDSLAAREIRRQQTVRATLHKLPGYPSRAAMRLTGERKWIIN